MYVRPWTILIKAGAAMAWLDLTIICLLLWGGIAGYLYGWKKTAARLTAVAAAVSAAVLFLGDLKIVISRHYPVEEAIRAVVCSRLAVPVSGASLQNPVVLSTLGVPQVLHQPLVVGHLLSTDLDFGLLADLLSRAILNALAFCAALALWYGLACLITASWLERKNGGETPWLGALLGVLRQYLLVTLVLGTAAPLLWLAGLPQEIFCLEEAILARPGLIIYNMFGIWWI